MELYPEDVLLRGITMKAEEVNDTKAYVTNYDGLFLFRLILD
jgi:hypothetical protein